MYVYTKKRCELGHPCNFSERTVELVNILPDPSLASNFIRPKTCDAGTQCAVEMSEHEVNTESVEFVSQGMNHVEGGWPKNCNPEDTNATARYRKNVEKEDGFHETVEELSTHVEHYINQNNAIDIYQEYFEDQESLAKSEGHQPSANIINVFSDPNEVKRTATGLSWHPLDNNKLAVAYSCIEFLKAPKNMSLDSYIWDIENYFKPEMTLSPVSPLVCLEYQPKDPHIIVGGSHNGQIAYWDTRNGRRPVGMSAGEYSHRDPVYKVIWLGLRDAFSASTDGQVLWWDVRNISKPTERLVLDLSKKGNLNSALGATSLEFNSTVPTKFMVGTEQGLVVLCNRTAPNPADKIACTYSRHLGSIYAIQRNPFFPKNFMTVGDWTARIWSEDSKMSPIMCTKYHMTYLLDGCWSPVRPSVFFTVQMNGTLDVWDMLCKSNEPTLTLKVCNEALNSIRVQGNGRFLCCGSQMGTVTMMEISSGLCTLQKNEKAVVSEMFTCETRREKILEGQNRDTSMKALRQNNEDEQKKEQEEKESSEELIKCAEEDFFHIVEAEMKRTENKRKETQKVRDRKWRNTVCEGNIQAGQRKSSKHVKKMSF